MTNESASLTEPWVEKHQATYAYAYDKGGKVQRFFGVNGIPHAILVDSTGTIVWRGHPGTLDDGTLNENLAGSLSKPLYDWPSSAKGVAKALVKGDFAQALAEAGKLSAEDDGPGVAAQVQALITARVKTVEKQLEVGNYLDALEGAETIGKGCKGLPEAETLAALASRVEAAADSAKVIDAQKKIRKLRAKDPSKRKEIERQIEDLEEIRQDMSGTYAAEEASAYMEALRDKLRR